MPEVIPVERLCRICQQKLNSRQFWDNIGVHQDCLDKMLSEVTMPPKAEAAK